ncbi:MAG: hypothetical protein JO345_17205 [Streptosporangiaceae bacterium]|nr:hypothetical protein [Streptosporangiaceae bacterium]
MGKGLPGALLGVAVGSLMLSACSGSGSSSSFVPGATAAATTQPAGAVNMPPFGKDVHVMMTGWLPGNATMARAVIADKNYELAYLYAEYRGGQDEGWQSYVSPAMQAGVRKALSARDVTTESFQGTIRIFAMRQIRDPLSPADVDVSACLDNAQAVNTNLTTGAVLPGQSPSDSNYYRYTDELAPTASGGWQVVSSYSPIYYPQAKECKP